MNETTNSQQEQIAQEATETKEMSQPLKLFTILLAMLFVIFALVSITGYDIGRVIFNPQLVKELLTEEIQDSDIVPVVLEYFSEQRAQQRVEKGEALSGVTEPDIILLMSFMDSKDWREIKDLLVKEEFVTHLVSVSVDELYRWIDSTDALPQVVWNMTSFKALVQGEQGEQSIMIAYRSLPECTQEEIDDFLVRLGEAPPGVEVLYNLCQFPDPWTDDQISDYVNSLIDVNQNIPDQFNFSEMLSTGGRSNNPNTETLKSQLRLLRLSMRWGWVIPILLLILIAALAVRSLKTLGSWVGIPLTITGLIVIVIGISARSVLSNFLSNLILNRTSSLLQQEAGNSLAHITSRIFQPMLWQGIILALIGIALIVLMVVKKTKTENG